MNTIDHLGKFAGKSDEGFLVGYSLQSKAFRVYNLETRRVEENLHITFLENKPNVAGKGPTWLFDLDYLTDSMNYHPVRSENQANHNAGQQKANHHAGSQEANQNAGTKDIIDGGDSEKEDESAQDCFVLLIWIFILQQVQERKNKSLWMNLKDLKGKKGKLMRKLKLSGRSLNKKLRTWLFKQELLSLAVLTFLVLLAHQLKLAKLINDHPKPTPRQPLNQKPPPPNPQQIPPDKTNPHTPTHSSTKLKNATPTPTPTAQRNLI
ncbi:hypothetical protein Tco_0513476 [Tanacetum coccineum]